MTPVKIKMRNLKTATSMEELICGKLKNQCEQRVVRNIYVNSQPNMNLAQASR